MKLNTNEKNWVLYDVGNSAFTMMVSTLIPIYLNQLASHSASDYLATWSFAVSIATLISAILGLVLGGLADHKDGKKPIFVGVVTIGAIFCGMLGFATSWQMYLAAFMVAKILYSISLVLYDSMLTDITDETRMDRVSAAGYAFGYIGSCIPFAAALLLYLFYRQIGISLSLAMKIAFCIVAFWWLFLTLPLFKTYKQKHYASMGTSPVQEAFKRLFATFKKIRQQKHIFLFLLAFFFYIDGVYTIIDEATAYGTALHISAAGLLIALLVTQFVAAPFSLLFGRLADKYPTAKLIRLCIIAYLCITIYAIFLQNLVQFFVLAITVGMFQGGVQSLSRSYFARMIPSEMSGEYFGFYDICGKGATVIGTFVVGTISKMTNSINLGVGAVAFIFLIGILLFNKADREVQKKATI